MMSFFTLKSADKRSYYQQAAIKTELPEVIVEKDFWVCWTFTKLFQLPEWGKHLTFKGGTSLSKCWKLIDRFSEDIDIVISRYPLGFDGAKAPDQAPSKKQRKQRLRELKNETQRCVLEMLLTLLEDVISQNSTHEEVAIEADTDDPDQQTFLLKYPSLFPNPAGYVRQVVKIEFGARSDTDPTEQIDIMPFIAEEYPDIFPQESVTVQANSS